MSAMGLGQSTGGVGAEARTHFSVAFTADLQGGEESQRIPFQCVLSSNPASAFSTESNQFTCTIPGSYFFTFTIHPEEAKAASVILMKNDTPQVLLVAHKNKRGPGTASQSAILDLEVDDTIWLQLQAGDQYGIRSHAGTPLVTFTGILVNPE